MTSLLTPRAIRGSLIAPVVASLLLSALLLAGLAARPSSTLALSCIMPPPIDEAVATSEIAFVGTVTALANGDHLASVSVEEVWKGPDLEAVVQVGNTRPANDPEAVWDRTYALGQRYLFLPTVEGGQLVDAPCGFTQEWQADFEKVRPADFRTPKSGEPEPVDPVAALSDLALPIGGVLLAAVVIIGGAMLVGRRQT